MDWQSQIHGVLDGLSFFCGSERMLAKRPDPLQAVFF